MTTAVVRTSPFSRTRVWRAAAIASEPKTRSAACVGPTRAAAGSGSSGGLPGLSALVGTSGGPMLIADMSWPA